MLVLLLQAVCHQDVAFEDIMAQPVQQLHALAKHLDLNLDEVGSDCRTGLTVQRLWRTGMMSSLTLPTVGLPVLAPVCSGSASDLICGSIAWLPGIGFAHVLPVSHPGQVLCLQADCAAVQTELQTLKPASRGAPDAVTKLWPGHYSAAVQARHQQGLEKMSESAVPGGQLDSKLHRQLADRFPQYFQLYNYS